MALGIITRMSISLDEVKEVAILARLELSDTELMDLQSQLNSMLDHFEDIQHLKTEGLDPAMHAVKMTNMMDADIIRPGLSRESALQNTQLSKAGLFIVPTIIEE